jgi:lysophospholipase L1-like esterase
MRLLRRLVPAVLVVVVAFPSGARALGEQVDRDASHGAFNYYGRWQRGTVAVTLNSGAMIEFAYRGGSCALEFDVSGFTHYPAVFVQADNGPPVVTPLSAVTATVPIAPRFGAEPKGAPPFAQPSSAYHVVRVWVATHSLYRTAAAGRQWSTLDGACRFRGVSLPGGELIPLPYCGDQIEFLGDSITQGLRLLYTGADDDIGQQLPYANWPQYVADLLNLKPVVTGFGGQGLSTPGTCGAPPVGAAFPFVYRDVPWVPQVAPKVVVIYQGTNDHLPADAFRTAYAALLREVRERYRSAALVAVCPNRKGEYAAAIAGAVAELADRGIVFLDYSSGVISPGETSDGGHLNPGGAVRLATRLAADIRTHLRR